MVCVALRDMTPTDRSELVECLADEMIAATAIALSSFAISEAMA